MLLMGGDAFAHNDGKNGKDPYRRGPALSSGPPTNQQDGRGRVEGSTNFQESVLFF